MIAVHETATGISSVAVGIIVEGDETMQVRKTATIGVDLEDRSNARTAATRTAIESVAR